MTTESLVEKAVGKFKTQTGLAIAFNRCGYKTVKQAHVWKWLQRGAFPAEWATAVEQVTEGEITAADVINQSQRRRQTRRVAA